MLLIDEGKNYSAVQYCVHYYTINIARINLLLYGVVTLWRKEMFF